MAIERILLASSSPFRKKLLASTGLKFSVVTAEVDEYSLIGATPGDTCWMRAKAKAEAVAATDKDALVIGCDQILEFEGRSFDKARDVEEAIDRLSKFAGKAHSLINWVTLTNHNHSYSEEFQVAVPMKMRSLSDAEIRAYASLDEWKGCVGCYQFENSGINLFEVAPADHSAIIGLPLAPLLSKLRGIGINPLLNPSGPWQFTDS